MSNNSAKLLTVYLKITHTKMHFDCWVSTVLLTCLSISPVETTTKVKPESFAKTCLTKMMTLIQKQNTVMKCAID